MYKNHVSNQWSDVIKTDIGHIDEYDTFGDLGKYTPAPVVHKKIWVHLVHYIKHDGHHKSKSVANVHLPDIPVKNVYSGVVSLCGI